MPRIYSKSTDREFPPEAMRQAVIDVIEHKMSIRQSANKNGVKKSRLCNYVKAAKEKGLRNLSFAPNYKKSQIFETDMENALENYLLKCSSMFYGLTPKATRCLAYEYAQKNSLRIPKTWQESKMAGKDWFCAFIKRHPTLSIRKPEATSLARMTSFNPTNVKIFHDKLEEVISRHGFGPSQIFNLDEVSKG